MQDGMGWKMNAKGHVSIQGWLEGVEVDLGDLR